jgi:hypothetical protein
MFENTGTLIARIRQSIGCGRCPSDDVLKLCERTEAILAGSIKLEEALHGALKIIEQKKA